MKYLLMTFLASSLLYGCASSDPEWQIKEFNNHSYVVYEDGSDDITGIEHNPDCACMKPKEALKSSK